VLENGAVVEEGTFEGLIALKGRFDKLVKDQYFSLPTTTAPQANTV